MSENVIIQWNFSLKWELKQEIDILWIDEWVYGDNIHLISIPNNSSDEEDDGMIQEIEDIFDSIYEEASTLYMIEAKKQFKWKILSHTFVGAGFEKKMTAIVQEMSIKVDTILEMDEYLDGSNYQDDDEFFQMVYELLFPYRDKIMHLLLSHTKLQMAKLSRKNISYHKKKPRGKK